MDREEQERGYLPCVFCVITHRSFAVPATGAGRLLRESLAPWDRQRIVFWFVSEVFVMAAAKAIRRTNSLKPVREALDEVEVGIVLLDDELRSSS
jgi:hypothetical protein